MQEHEKLQIIEDLMLEFPEGPGPNSLQYDKIIIKETTARPGSIRYIPKESNYGYDPTIIFSLGIRAYTECRDIITRIVCGDYCDIYDREKVSDKQKRFIQNRAPDVWSRLCRAMSKIQKEGGRGIYKVYNQSSFFNPPLGFVYAKNKQDAIDCCDILFSGLCDDKKRLIIEFYGYEDVNAAISHNREILQKMSSSIETSRVNVDNLNRRILKYETALQRLSTILDVQLSLVEKQCEQKDDD